MGVTKMDITPFGIIDVIGIDLMHNIARRDAGIWRFLPPVRRVLSFLFRLIVSGITDQQVGAREGGMVMERTELVYKTVDGTKLLLHVFRVKDRQEATSSAAIVFFFGGGWRQGTPEQFYPQCEYFAARDMVAMSADYRVHSRQGVSPVECVADGKSAIRWIRLHSEEIGIDPNRIVAGGGSAGGHVAACAGIVNGLDEPDEDLNISSRPNALVLFNPVVDLSGIAWRGRTAESPSEEQRKEISPVLHVERGLPPTIVFHGTADQVIPFGTVERFSQLMKEAGNVCELVPFEGKGHGFFNYGRHGNQPYEETLRAADQFLSSLGYLD